MSLFSRIWKRIINPTSCVGKDLEGNKYFEYPNPQGGNRTKRVVKYRKGYDMWTYVAGQKRLPVQWTSWLTHTRSHPPTVQELLADLERQRRVLLNAALIEARDKEAQVAASITDAPHQPTPRDSSPVAPAGPSQGPSTQSPQSVSKSEQSAPSSPTVKGGQPTESKPDPFARPTIDEAQPWSPRSIRRGS
ncbi:hypothetical protein C8Q75DRAFT_804768 [Abortiporus biennis]|nr:hypothetical protein C8Q75DRAFT_804768 [Abortiporus biennis]